MRISLLTSMVILTFSTVSYAQDDDYFFCDGVYLKNGQGKELASSANCKEDLLAPIKGGLFCDGIYLKNIQGKELAYSANCKGKFLNH